MAWIAGLNTLPHIILIQLIQRINQSVKFYETRKYSRLSIIYVSNGPRSEPAQSILQHNQFNITMPFSLEVSKMVSSNDIPPQAMPQSLFLIWSAYVAPSTQNSVTANNCYYPSVNVKLDFTFQTPCRMTFRKWHIHLKGTQLDAWMKSVS
jgi:hypothetical protein